MQKLDHVSGTFAVAFFSINVNHANGIPCTICSTKGPENSSNEILQKEREITGCCGACNFNAQEAKTGGFLQV